MDFFPSSRPALVTDAVVAPIANGEILVATADNRKALVLNETGAIVVSLCDGECTLEAISSLFAETLGIDEERALADVRGLLARLDSEGLLQKSRDSKTS